MTISPSDALLRELFEERLAEFGEVAVEGLAVAALDEEVFAVAEDDGAEAVPLGLEAPGVGVGGDFVDALGEHGEDRGWEWRGHGGLDAGLGRDGLGVGLAVFDAGFDVWVCGVDESGECCFVGGGGGGEFYVAHAFAGALEEVSGVGEGSSPRQAWGQPSWRSSRTSSPAVRMMWNQ
jgi:hypothetical protein